MCIRDRQWGTNSDIVKDPMPIAGDAVASDYVGAYFFGEGDSRSIAHNTIGNFLNSAKPVSEGGHGGFYIGRYEQGSFTISEFVPHCLLVKSFVFVVPLSSTLYIPVGIHTN